MRQAGVAAGTFAVTIAVGFVLLPAGSRTWWLDGLFVQGSRTGFVGWQGNQSLQALITRLSGQHRGRSAGMARSRDRDAAGRPGRGGAPGPAGHRVVGVLTCALTGLLVSPISWDHHWVWIVPAVTVLAVYGLRATGPLRWCYLAGAALVTALFGAWPGFLWGQPPDLGGFWMGLIWIPPNTSPGVYARHGDQPSSAGYHWHGFQLLTGNLYVLAGLVAMMLACVLAARSVLARRRPGPRGPPIPPGPPGPAGRPGPPRRSVASYPAPFGSPWPAPLGVTLAGADLVRAGLAAQPPYGAVGRCPDTQERERITRCPWRTVLRAEGAVCSAVIKPAK